MRFLRRKLGLGEHEGVFCYVNSVFAPGLDEGVGNLWRVSFFLFIVLLLFCCYYYCSPFYVCLLDCESVHMPSCCSWVGEQA